MIYGMMMGIVNQCSTGLHVASDVAAHLIASCIIFPHCRLKDDFTIEYGKGVIVADTSGISIRTGASSSSDNSIATLKITAAGMSESQRINCLEAIIINILALVGITYSVKKSIGSINGTHFRYIL